MSAYFEESYTIYNLILKSRTLAFFCQFFIVHFPAAIDFGNLPVCKGQIPRSNFIYYKYNDS